MEEALDLSLDRILNEWMNLEKINCLEELGLDVKLFLPEGITREMGIGVIRL